MPWRVERPAGPAAAVILVAGLALRLALLFGPLDRLLQTVPDDAFYYLQTAVNLAAGRGVTFDGLHPATGYQPLWLWLLLPLARLTSEPYLLLRLALLLGIAANLLAAVLFYRLLRQKLAGWLPATLALGLFYLNPSAVINSVNGLETAVATLLFVVALALVLADEPQPGRLGLILGLLFLARTDTIFYLAALAGVAAWRRAAGSAGPGRWWPAVTSGRQMLLPALAVAGPWLAWNLLSFGQLWPSSAAAVPYVKHYNYLTGHTTAEAWRFSLLLLWRFVRFDLDWVIGWPGALQLVLFAAGLIAARRRRPVGEGWQATAVLTGACWLAAGVLLVVHAAIRWLAREWYFDQAILLAALTVGLAAATWAPLRRPWLAGLLLATALLPFVALSWARLQTPHYPHQLEMVDAAAWLNEQLAPGEYAAAFNAGIMGYLTGGRVVNLDGAINQTAYEALLSQSLLAMMRAAGVRYYLDYHPLQIAVYTPYLGDESLVSILRVATIDRPDVTYVEAPDDPIAIFRLEWDAGR